MGLGLTIAGVIQFEKELTMLRLGNIIDNYSEPIREEYDKLEDKIIKKYNRIEIENNNEEEIIEFDDEKVNRSPEQIQAEEELLSKFYNKKIYKTYISPTQFKNLLCYRFEIIINPTEKSNDNLKMLMFKQNLSFALQVWGEQVNIDGLKERFANIAGEDVSKFFVKKENQNIINESMPIDNQQSMLQQLPQTPQIPQEKLTIKAQI
jgi:hypothetical protein